MTCGRLFIDDAADGAWNMAVDEAMLDWVAAGAGPLLRFYRWSEATVSLGYFQRLKERFGHASSADCPVVRRPSGGGAIIHDAELTYSLAMPAADRSAALGIALYQGMHAALVSALSEFGARATLWQLSGRSDHRPPFLCFERRGEGDVLLGDHKVAGSAQRRRRGAILQHGSVLLRTSLKAPELPGVGNLLGRPISPEALIEGWLERISADLHMSWTASTITAAEQRHAWKLKTEKYDSASWIDRR